MQRRLSQLGQVLPLFALFLVVLLGAAALAIDYGSWLLTDRALQNVADHAALAGASQFAQRQTQAACTSTGTQCANALAHAWASVNSDLNLGLTDASIAQLASQGNAPDGGWLSVTASGVTQTFRGHTIWVSTPPPTYSAYTNAGGRYSSNFGIMFVRVDRPTQSLLGGVFGLHPGPRTGWATAGALPTDFALQTFCRNGVYQNCVNSAGLTIDGQGAITLLRGDVASNESLKVTASGGSGVILEAGNAFVVNGSCGSSSWSCPVNPPQGGISDGTTTGAKNAYYMAPLAVPRFASPLEYATLTTCPTTSQWNANQVPCVPQQTQPGNASSGTWVCGNGGTSPACGIPTVTTTNGVSSVTCGAGSYDPTTRDMRPNLDETTQKMNGSQFPTLYQNVNDPTIDPAGNTLPAPPASQTMTGTVQNSVYSSPGFAATYRVGLTPPLGVPQAGFVNVSFVIYKTQSGLPVTTGNNESVTVQLYQKQGNRINPIGTPIIAAATGTVTANQSLQINTASVPGGDYANLYLQFDIAKDNASGANGFGVSWIQVETPPLQPPQPPTINAGLWQSISVPSGCAVLDPSPSTGLQQYQLPGVFRFSGAGNAITIGAGAYLIGDGVSLVFDSNWSDPTGGKGIVVGNNGALVLNTAIHGGYNPSSLSDLPYDAVNAAWQVNPATIVGTHPGSATWPVCTIGGNSCVPRSCYMNTDPAQCNGQVTTPIANGRGITFYFTPSAWPPSSIRGRFKLSGSSGNSPGIAFRGVLYAPYDDVEVSGSNGFNTVGQVLAWTAKFNGGSASIILDYPYAFVPASPYLLEPTVAH